MAGDVVHYEIGVSDVARAQRFWEGVFGWSFGDSVMPEGEYRMAPVSERAGVALSSYGEPGHPNVYLDVDDIDASIAKVRELGGEAADKQPVPTHGWFSGCKDTEGNEFHLWQSDSSAGQ